VRLAPADALPRAELAALFTASYEGYFVPVNVDEASLEFMVTAFDIDLGRSRVAFDGDEPVGLAFLGVRGDRGWIGGLGVVPAARRRGLGRALMKAVLAEAPPAVVLEVLEQNEPAIRLYDDLGFVRRRRLEVWSLREETPPGTVRTEPPRPLGQTDLPWQREDASLPEGYERIEVDGGAALVVVNGPRISILQLEATDERPARELLAAARARGETLHYLNVPEGDPASAALGSLGGSLDLRQFELELSRATSAPRG
jgi:ribosomal protein S18 acetylase RimI-like enzyme